MKMMRPSGVLVAGVVATGAVVAAVVVVLSGGSEAASAQPGRNIGYSPGAVVAQWARQAGIAELRALVSAGSGDREVAIVTGKNAAGVPCWTAVGAGGRVAGPFRCGTVAPTPSSAVVVFASVSGPAGSTAADSVTLVGVTRPDVVSVEALLIDGTTKELAMTNGTFTYAATLLAELATAVRGYDRTGRLIREETINLGGGPEG